MVRRTLKNKYKPKRAESAPNGELQMLRKAERRDF